MILSLVGSVCAAIVGLFGLALVVGGYLRARSLEESLDQMSRRLRQAIYVRCGVQGLYHDLVAEVRHQAPGAVSPDFLARQQDILQGLLAAGDLDAMDAGDSSRDGRATGHPLPDGARAPRERVR